MSISQPSSVSAFGSESSGAAGGPLDPAKLADAIVEAVAYADVFDYPLTAQEIHRYLPRLATPGSQVKAILDDGRLVPERLAHAQGYFMLPGRTAIVETRRRRAQAAAALWPKGIHYGHLIARLPFVRMVAVTGALAVDNSHPDDDLDYLVVTERGRLWLCRALVIGLVRLARRRGDVICPNYFLSEHALELEAHDLYTAHELAQMVPLSGYPIYARMRALNRWVYGYLPNATGTPREVTAPPPASWFPQSAAEALLRTPPGGWLERWEMRRKIRKLTTENAASIPIAEVDFGPDFCKGHFGGYGEKTLLALSDRLNRLER